MTLPTTKNPPPPEPPLRNLPLRTKTSLKAGQTGKTAKISEVVLPGVKNLAESYTSATDPNYSPIEPLVPTAKLQAKKKRLTNRKRTKCMSMVMPDNNPK